MNPKPTPRKPIIIVSSTVPREEAILPPHPNNQMGLSPGQAALSDIREMNDSTTNLLHELVTLNLEIVTLDNERAALSHKLETAIILQKPLIVKRDRLMKDLRKALGEKF